MTDLEKEALEYAVRYNGMSHGVEACIDGYVAGANSNYAKQQILKSKIEVLEDILYCEHLWGVADLTNHIQELHTNLLKTQSHGK